MVLSMAHIAEQEGCLGAVQSDGAAEIDIATLVDSWQPPHSGVIDGHLSHLLPVEAIIILRCHPEVLRKRLEERGYSPEKVQANVEIELLGGPWNDLIADERPILEIDCSLETRLTIVTQWIDDGCPHSTTVDDAIDWVQNLVDERNPL
jgi:adenylate kinase